MAKKSKSNKITAEELIAASLDEADAADAMLSL
jgi:hypothetical protein